MKDGGGCVLVVLVGAVPWEEEPTVVSILPGSPPAPAAAWAVSFSVGVGEIGLVVAEAAEVSMGLVGRDAVPVDF